MSNWVFSGINQETAAAIAKEMQLQHVVEYILKHAHEADLPILDASKPDFVQTLAEAFLETLRARKAAKLRKKAEKAKAKAQRKTSAASLAVERANDAVLRLERYPQSKREKVLV